MLAWLAEERAKGRTIALASACDRAAVETVARHVGVFDAVFASDGETNLKSAAKAQALTAAYPGGFVYAGNESADLKVWRASRLAVVVNAPPDIVAKAKGEFKIERLFAR